MRKEFVIHILIFLVLISSCSINKSMLKLNTDSINIKEGYSSIVLWRIRIKDRISIKNDPDIFIYQLKKSDNGATDAEIVRLNYNIWNGGESSGEGSYRPYYKKVNYVEKDGVWYSDYLVMTEAKPKEYYFSKLYFLIGISSSTTTTIGGTITSTTTTFLEPPINKAIFISPNRLVYLGVFDMELNSKENNNYNYTLNISQGQDNFKEDIKSFQNLYPTLYEQFKDNMEFANWYPSLIEEFYTNANGWLQGEGKDYSANMYLGYYWIENKDDNNCRLQTINAPIDMKKDYDIELKSELKKKEMSSGDNDKYGLMFGEDIKNSYQFGIAEDGESVIWQYVDGKYVAIPDKWKTGTAIINKRGDKNNQKIEIRGNKFKYYINGQYLGEIKNEIAIADWKVGVVVCGRQKVAFDRLTILKRR